MIKQKTYGLSQTKIFLIRIFATRKGFLIKSLVLRVIFVLQDENRLIFLNLPMHEEGPATLYWIYVLSMLIQYGYILYTDKGGVWLTLLGVGSQPNLRLHKCSVLALPLFYKKGPLLNKSHIALVFTKDIFSKTCPDLVNLIINHVK